ncbi:MAG: N-acetylmuramic acid 6-phosphate etherase [Clostridia bacterium]|nr:N-acetylmuramic acid 6-phosphate etherase [Clostridia bacterium]
MLKTEMRNPKTMKIHKMSTLEQLKVMSEENENAVRAVEAELPHIEKAVNAITNTLKAGGRLFYIGAGTSGRLGVLDACECPPTFGVEPDTVIGIIAGGDIALKQAQENVEDNPDAGIEDLKSYGFCKQDVLVGISAAGNARYVTNAVEYANLLGAITIGVTSNEESMLDRLSAISICTDTGAEVITGSTRLKAGTAQKLVLNMLSTVSMIQCGYVYENMMVNLKPTNNKLKMRMIGIVCEILKCDEKKAECLLNSYDWSIPAVVENTVGNYSSK